MAMGLHSSGGGRGRGRGGRRAPMADINVTPFVDVMLVLLIIFMVTAPLLVAGVPVDLPESRANPLDQQPEQVTISIDREGFIYIDDVLVERGALPQKLDELQRPGDEPLIVVRGDTALNWGRIAAVLGELNRSGFNKVSLVTNGSSEAP